MHYRSADKLPAGICMAVKRGEYPDDVPAVTLAIIAKSTHYRSLRERCVQHSALTARYLLALSMQGGTVTPIRNYSYMDAHSSVGFIGVNSSYFGEFTCKC